MALEQKIAIAQINPTLGDLVGNGEKIVEYIERAKTSGAGIVVFPQAALTGWPLQDLGKNPDFIKDTKNIAKKIAKYAGGISVVMGQGEEFLENNIFAYFQPSQFYAGRLADDYETLKLAGRQIAIHANIVGGQDGAIFDGGSIAVNPDGTVCCQLPQFEEALGVIDLANPKHEALKTLPFEAEAFKGLTLGLQDFFRKNGLRKAVLGLSGGIDSALTACIAVASLGKENVLGIALPSQNNPGTSLEDAKTLAERLGIGFDVVPIGGMYDAVMKELAPKFDNKPFDVTEENIQARMRMVVLMAYTNKHSCTMLCTGDASEAALGYCTLYGDLAGAIAPIADLTKPEVYAVSRWYNKEKGAEIIPASTLTKPPSPELKPGQVAPFDYNRLAPLLEGLARGESIACLKEKGYALDEIKKMYRKLRNSEFKRHQAPVGLACKKIPFRTLPITNHYVPSALFEG